MVIQEVANNICEFLLANRKIFSFLWIGTNIAHLGKGIRVPKISAARRQIGNNLLVKFLGCSFLEADWGCVNN